MTAAVCEVGPASVRVLGSPSVQPDSCAAAVLGTCVDTLVVVDDTVLPVEQVWRRVLTPLLRGRSSVRFIHPTWWPPPRVALLVAAAEELVDCVETVTRLQALADDDAVVVEIAEHLVVIGRSGAPRTAIPRPMAGADDPADAVVRAVLETPSSSVHLDAPPGVPGADALAASIARRLQGTRAVAHARLPSPHTSSQPGWGPRRGFRVWPPLAAALVVAVAVTAWVAAPESEAPTPVRALVEGRVATAIPDGWEITRVRSGPGSARVAVTAPDGATALHITQAAVPGRGLAEVAADLRTALDEQPPGVFTDFHPHDVYADRPVVGYTERRGDREIRWLVLVDGSTRIGIGCQSPAGAPGEVARACEHAVRTAREIT